MHLPATVTATILMQHQQGSSTPATLSIAGPTPATPS